MKELIQNKNWFKNHNQGIGFYATHKAINKNNENDIRYFIGGTNEIKNKLGTKYYIYTI